MGDVVTLHKNIKYRGVTISLTENNMGVVEYSFKVSVKTPLYGSGNDLNEAIDNARSMIDRMLKKK